MPAILGIDAAWTVSNPSGIALIQNLNGVWRCVQVCPDAKSFIEAAFGPQVWLTTYTMTALVTQILAAADALAHEPVTVVALDLPLSRQPIRTRRVADDATSQVCGRVGCPTHSPSETRPGMLSEAYHDALRHGGFSLCTNDVNEPPEKQAIEVYPHPAIIALLGAHFRLPYKVGKTNNYWPGVPLDGRWRLIIGVLGRILTALQEQIVDIKLELPSPDRRGSFSCLKSFEDMLDALVCAWVGMQHMMQRTRALGDRDAAIWLPDYPQLFANPNNQDQPE